MNLYFPIEFLKFQQNAQNILFGVVFGFKFDPIKICLFETDLDVENVNFPANITNYW